MDMTIKVSISLMAQCVSITLFMNLRFHIIWVSTLFLPHPSSSLISINGLDQFI